MRNTLLAFLCSVSIGCSSEASRYPVSGVVTIDGKPAPLTVITFIAVNPSTPTSSGGAAITDEQGNFTVKGKDKEGLMAGDYKVVFQQSLIDGKPSLNGSRGKKNAMLAGETEGVPSQYLDPDTTPVTIAVKKNMDPCQFDLKK